MQFVYKIQPGNLFPIFPKAQAKLANIAKYVGHSRANSKILATASLAL
jgi:hypothetical protein